VLSPEFREIVSLLSEEGSRLLVTGIGEQNGGIGYFDDDGFILIDRLSSTGIASTGSLLARAITTVHLPGADGTQRAEIAIFDEDGLLRIERFDGIGELHDLHIDDTGLTVVSTGSDKIVRIESAQGFRPSYTTIFGSGRRVDSWHLNCITSHAGDLYATAFGLKKGWSWRRSGSVGAPSSADGTGVLFNVTTNTIVAENFTKPHSPRRWRESWVVADSGENNIVIIDDDGQRTTIDCLGWTRGLSIINDVALVGISARRLRDPSADSHLGHVLLVDLNTRRIVGKAELPFDEVYDVSLVATPLVNGLRKGVASNALRIFERVRSLGLLENHSIDVPTVPEQQRRALVETTLPSQVVAGSELELDVTVTYEGTTAVASLGDHAVSLGWYWDDAGGHEQGRCGFAQVLEQGDTLHMVCPIAVPFAAGEHLLHVGLVQEAVAWFDGGLDVTVFVSEKEDL